MILSYAAVTWLLLLTSPLAISARTCAGDFKAGSQQDLDTLKTCRKYKGSILVENSGASVLKLPGIELLNGDLMVIDNDGLQRLSLPSLQGINGQLKLSNNKAMHTLEMPKVTALRSFEISVHPALNTIRFPSGLHQVEKLSISDTTATRIEGLKMQHVNDLVVANNIYLKSLAFSNLTQVTNSLTVSANSPSLHVDFAGLKNMTHGSFRNLASMDMSSLQRVTGDISFISNTFTSLWLPKVSDIAGTLTISNNMQLNNLSLPELSHLGGALSVGNNTELQRISAFPKLQEIDGTLDVTGAFDEVELPALGDVRGGLNVQTSSNHFSCEGVNKLKNGVIKGNSFTCKAAVAKPRSGLPGKNGVSEESNAPAATWMPVTTIVALLGVASAYLIAL